MLQANRHHPTIKFTAKISQKEINYPDSKVFRFHKETVRACTETFQYTHAPVMLWDEVKGFIKGEGLILLTTNSSGTLFEEKKNY